MRRLLRCSALIALTLLTTGATCDSGSPSSDSGMEPSSDTEEVIDTGVDTADAGDTLAGDADVATDADGEADVEAVQARITHQFEPYQLEPGEEATTCVQWTPGNTEPIYVNTVTMANGGGFHHSNWFIVPNDYAPGKDGYFDCSERRVRNFTAAIQGSVLFAQSTQAQSEVQSFPKGIVTKIPPNHKIIGDLHFLNIKPQASQTSARLTLGLTHPRHVETVAAPFLLTYDALNIPPESEARFTSECDFKDAYESTTGEEFDDLKLYYVLPHYHGLGNWFGLELFGGERDGETIFELEGFNAEANGQTFNPPVSLANAEGFRFGCGYDNPRDEWVDWGIGGDEMCMMLGYTNGASLFVGQVGEGQKVGTEGGIVRNEGSCDAVAIPPSERQSMPTEEEKTGEMHVPDSDQPEDIDPIPDCEDRPGTAEPLREPTLTNLKTNFFSVGCGFTSCHDTESPAANLDLTADDLHAELTGHEMVTPTDMPLVKPGKPSESWLYKVTSECEPESKVGPVSHMPRNAPTLTDPEVLAMLREWIARGAKDN